MRRGPFPDHPNMNTSIPVAAESTGAASSPTPTASPEPIALRILRGLALLGLALILTLFLALAAVASIPLLAEAVSTLFAWEGKLDRTAGGITLGVVVLVPLVLVLVGYRLRLRSWWWIAGGYLAVTPVLVYLASDDPIVLHRTTVDEFAPAFPGAEKSYATLMQYSKQQPSAEAKAFAQWKQRVVGMPVNPDQPDAWNAFLVKNRAAIEADWTDLGPQRRWLAELNAFDRFGDLGQPTVSENIISFGVWRALSQRTMHVAGLQMLDGKPDDAIATLLPMLQASRKLQPSARTLVRLMVGIVVEKMIVSYAAQILDQATVSPANKAKLAAALHAGVRGEAGARRLIAVEHLFQNSANLERPLGNLIWEMRRDPPALKPFVNAVGPFLYNPRHTLNLVADVNFALQDLAARRAFTRGGSADTIVTEKSRPRFKNFYGAIMIRQLIPAFTKVVEAYWDLDDRREKLAARLASHTERH